MSIDEAHEALGAYERTFQSHYFELLQQKLGLFNTSPHSSKANEKLILSLMTLLHQNHVDYTMFFRQLSSHALLLQTDASVSAAENETPLRDLFMDRDAFDAWSRMYKEALDKDPLEAVLRKKKMDRINPKYVLRNYMAQIAIEKAVTERNYSEIDKLFKLLSSPFDEHPDQQHYAGLPPDWAEKISISCSS